MPSEKTKQYLETYHKDSAPGWEAIDKRLAEIYKGIKARHVPARLHMVAGGDEALYGVSIFKSDAGGQEHYHYISYGLTNLYRDEAYAEQKQSGFGFEFTFRLKPFKEDREWPTWPVQLMQNLARYVVNTKKTFHDYHLIPIKGGIRVGTNTITALVFYEDQELGSITTPNGQVQFLQLYGITQKEYERITTSTEKEVFEGVTDLVLLHLNTNPLLITDLERSKI